MLRLGNDGSLHRFSAPPRPAAIREQPHRLRDQLAVANHRRSHIASHTRGSRIGTPSQRGDVRSVMASNIAKGSTVEERG